MTPRRTAPSFHRAKSGTFSSRDNFRLKGLDYLDEASPQFSPLVVRLPLSLGDQVADLCAAGTRKRLTRRTSCDEVNRFHPPLRQVVEKRPVLAQVFIESRAAKVRAVRLKGHRIRVDGGDDGESGARSSKTKSPAPQNRSTAHGLGCSRIHRRASEASSGATFAR
jgi:hypothetical protein